VRLRLEKRETVGPALQAAALALALGGAALVTALMLRLAGANVLDAFVALVRGSVGSGPALARTLVKATPLILTGLATVVAFQAKVWNIGQEGQLYSGAILAYWAYLIFGWLPPAALFPVILVFAFVGGAICASIAAAAKARFNVDEIITTIMLNYIVTYLLSLLLSGPWKDPASYYRHTPPIVQSAQFPVIVPGTGLHTGLIVSLVAAGFVYLILGKTALGYEIRAAGFNPIASRFQGISLTRILVVVMLLSGGLAGLAGAGELFGVGYRLEADISLGYGYTGIIIAMLADLQPLAVIPAAVFFGGLINGASLLQVITGVPSALSYALQAVVLLFLLGARAVVAYRVRRVGDA
jgi:ABC-type uncharacterized transport system permease subunit